MAALPALAALIAAAFAVGCWRAGPTAALRVWAFALAQFALASAALAFGMGAGWSPAVFRVYYLFGAVLNVLWLGLGTLWLLLPRPAAVVASLVVGALSAWAGAAVLGAPVREAALAATVPHAREALGESVRAFSRWFSIAGSVVVVGGLGWSLARRRGKAAGLGLLAGGVAVAGVASELARAGLVAPFAAGLVAGVALMYAGFLRTR